MKLKKTLALTMAAMAVCASAFAGVSVKSYDVDEDWVKIEVNKIKGWVKKNELWGVQD